MIALHDVELLHALLSDQHNSVVVVLGVLHSELAGVFLLVFAIHFLKMSLHLLCHDL